MNFGVRPTDEDSFLGDMSRRSSSYSRWFRARQPKKIGRVVAQLMQRRGYAQIENARRLEEAWQSVIGDFASSTRVGTVRRGTLEVLVASSLMMQELTFQKQRILQAMQQAYPEGKINKIRFRVGNTNSTGRNKHVRDEST
jgi:predicted nucleic acid-binding Zn ribbon protein